MIHHTRARGAETSPDLCGNDRLLPNGSRPPWLVLLVGFLVVDGLFGTVAVLTNLPYQPNLLYMLPPLSFMDWYAYGDPLGWAYSIVEFLDWTTPLLELAAACAIWRRPPRTQRVIFTVGGALALGSVLKAFVPYPYIARGYHWDLSQTTGGLADLALALFAIWFVRRFRSLARPEAALLAVYLILSGCAGLGAAIDKAIDEGISQPIGLIRGYASWSYVLVKWPVVDIVVATMTLMGGLLLCRRKNTPVRSAGALVVLAGAADLGLGLLTSVVGVYGPFLSAPLYDLNRLSRPLGQFVLALAIARFLWRNGALFLGPEPLCRTCGYNLTGNVSGTCPECGSRIESGAERATRPAAG